jgi:hypothetical protein
LFDGKFNDADITKKSFELYTADIGVIDCDTFVSSLTNNNEHVNGVEYDADGLVLN